MTGAKVAQERRLRTAQVIAALYSILFVVAIGYGYFVLSPANHFLGVLGGLVIAGIAWNVARFIGGHEGGIVAHLPLFVLLLIVSAVGVFNTLMLNLEGRQIFMETINQADRKYSALESVARTNLVNVEIDKRKSRILALKDALIAEILNPQNCGQGSKAQEIMTELQTELPSFTPLNVPSIDCRQNSQLAEEYKKKILNDLLKSPWYIESGYEELEADRSTVISKVTESKVRLQSLRDDMGSIGASALLSEAAPELRELGATYSDAVELLHRHGPAPDVTDRIDLSLLESLGQWSQLINLLLARLDKPSTYVYLAIAIFADWMMIYLFQLVRLNRIGRRSSSSSFGMFATPWK
jgi:hypothetical protein